jgi:hypothetical protein
MKNSTLAKQISDIHVFAMRDQVEAECETLPSAGGARV